jgi:hypothetical protein
MSRRIFLAIDKDYSVIQQEIYSVETKDYDNGWRPIARYLNTQLIHSDFEDLGNGIWLPRKSITMNYDASGKVINQDTVEVEKMEMNNVKDTFFTDFIPENSFVADGIGGLTYRWNERASIGGLLKETVKPKSTRLYQRISVIIGLIMIVLAVIFEIRKRILQRRGS